MGQPILNLQINCAYPEDAQALKYEGHKIQTCPS
jgi:hypothetical protein